MDIVEQDRNHLVDKIKTVENQRDDLLRKGRVVESERNDFLRNNKLMEMQRDDLESRCTILQKTNVTLNSRVSNADVFAVLGFYQLMKTAGSVEFNRQKRFVVLLLGIGISYYEKEFASSR